MRTLDSNWMTVLVIATLCSLLGFIVSQATSCDVAGRRYGADSARSASEQQKALSACMASCFIKGEPEQCRRVCDAEKQ